MDFKYANAEGLGTKKHEDLPPKRMKSYSYASSLYTCIAEDGTICIAEDGTVWVSNDTYTWRKVDA